MQHIPRQKMSFSSVVLVVFSLFLMARLAMPVSNLITDQASLLQLKAHITSDPNNFFAYNWSNSESPCNWVGVTCSARHQRVIALNLPNMNLGGLIPPHLGNLSFLASLNISGNNFQGSLPKELGQLRRLKIIDLSDNSLSSSLPGDICKSLTELESLDVSSNEISGHLPSSLGDCSKLKSLLLTDNKFTGWIPQSIGNLTMLTELYLDNNNLEGPFPQTIFNISSLKSISLANNSISGNLPTDFCHTLPLLEKLALSDNEFTGSITENIGNCTLLEILALSDNHLTGEIPNELGKLYNLKFLGLGTNNLSAFIPPVIFNISSLEFIQLEENHFIGHLPSNIGLYLPNLQRLNLLGNNLSGTIPSSISNASKLMDLELSKNSFSGLIPNTFSNCRQLRLLNLVDNYLTTESSTLGWSFLSSLTNCRYLRSIGLENNPLNGMLPTSIGNLSLSLQYFYAGACELEGGIPVEVGNLRNMVALSLFLNNLTGSIPATAGKLQKLQGLDLSSNKLQGSIPSDLCQLESLSTLLLYENELEGLIPTCIGNLTSLRLLYLDNNKLNSTIPSTFWNLRYILQVDLSSNSLSGSLPIDVTNLEVLNLIDLSDNQLSGSIPSNIGDLKDLTFLDLARNGFEGSIPQSLGSLLSLETLDLSGNNLSGIITKSLEALSDLTYFNVSFNGLEGEVPNEGPFVNFSAESFMSNYALCGSPRLQIPPCKNSSVERSKKANTVLLRFILPIIVPITVGVALIITIIRCRKRDKNVSPQNDLLNLAVWKRISYYELQQLTNGFSECSLLGTGSFGSVYKATLSNGMNIAVKVFNLQLDGGVKSFDAECEVMRAIRHRNLVKIISSCSNTGFKAIILQYMPKGSLDKWLYSHNYFLDIIQRLDIMIDVASALEYLHHGHSTPVIHCDLKPHNILLDDDMVAHVSDFGIAKLLDGVDSIKHTVTLATIGYMAPEGIISTRGDVYSFGILLMETFTRRKPTDEIFTEEMSLKHWVEETLHHSAVTEVVDANLLSREEDHFVAKKDCLSSILNMALKCSAKIPEERMNIKDASVTLKKIKTKFLKDVEHV